MATVVPRPINTRQYAAIPATWANNGKWQTCLLSAQCNECCLARGVAGWCSAVQGHQSGVRRGSGPAWSSSAAQGGAVYDWPSTGSNGPISVWCGAGVTPPHPRPAAGFNSPTATNQFALRILLWMYIWSHLSSRIFRMVGGCLHVVHAGRVSRSRSCFRITPGFAMIILEESTQAGSSHSLRFVLQRRPGGVETYLSSMEDQLCSK